MGAESGFFVPGSGFAAVRITGELPASADGLSGVVAAAVLGATVWVVELARPAVLVEGAGCPEFSGVLTACGAGVVLDLFSFP
jgi:hypothetical protein